MSIKVSVVIPVYNVEKYIEECIDSVIKQSMHEIEIIVVDDGSKDRSGKILDNYAQKDPRVLVIHQENGGVSSARNTGLAKCSGKYVYIMDSDDYLEPDALEKLYLNAEETKADVVIADHYTFRNKKSQFQHHYFSKEFVTEDQKIIQQIQNMVLHDGFSPYLTSENKGLGIATPWNKLLSRELIDNNELRFDPYVLGTFDDGLFALSVFQYVKKVSYIRAYIYHYRVIETSLIHRYNPNRRNIDQRVFQRIREFTDKYAKDGEFIEAYHGRVIIYLVQEFRVYFFNANNDLPAKQLYKEFKELFSNEVNAKAIRQVPLRKLTKAVHVFVVVFARAHLIFLIWFPFRALRMFAKFCFNRLKT